MRFLNLLGIAGLVLGCAASAFAQAGQPAPAVELKVGDKAPNFKLQGSDGKTYNLSDFAGKKAVVIAWFPAAFTKGCTVECKSLAMNGDKIRAYDVAYFMASTDPIEKNTDFAKAQEADFPLLSDPTKEVAAAYGVLNARGTASRWTFYIGKDGRILAIDKTIKVDTSAEDMVAKLGELNVAKTKSN
jgi:thioredoxin-dependent peroxiredoxin